MNKWKKRFYGTLSGQMLVVFLVGAIIAGVLFRLLEYVGKKGIDYYFEHSSYIEDTEKRYIEDLQKFVEQNQISSYERDRITQWTKQQQIVYLLLYKDGKLVYDSYYDDEELVEDYANSFSTSWQGYDTLQFEDGEVKVMLCAYIEYKFYAYIKFISLIISLVALIEIILLWVRKKVIYIRRLRDDIKFMEGGCLTQKVTMQGNDELYELASSLEQMRLSMIENIKLEEQLTLANRNLVTGMSHDLRTPLTTLLLYLELMRKTDYTEYEKMQSYLQKTYDKAMQIKQQSDQLFDFFLVSREEKIQLEDPQSMMDVWKGYLSEMIAYLEDNNYRVLCDELIWNPVSIAVRRDYIERILDNIYSNILKYADKTELLY